MMAAATAVMAAAEVNSVTSTTEPLMKAGALVGLDRLVPAVLALVLGLVGTRVTRVTRNLKFLNFVQMMLKQRTTRMLLIKARALVGLDHLVPAVHERLWQGKWAPG